MSQLADEPSHAALPFVGERHLLCLASKMHSRAYAFIRHAGRDLAMSKFQPSSND